MNHCQWIALIRTPTSISHIPVADENLFCADIFDHVETRENGGHCSMEVGWEDENLLERIYIIVAYDSTHNER